MGHICKPDRDIDGYRDGKNDQNRGYVHWKKNITLGSDSTTPHTLVWSWMLQHGPQWSRNQLEEKHVVKELQVQFTCIKHFPLLIQVSASDLISWKTALSKSLGLRDRSLFMTMLSDLNTAYFLLKIPCHAIFHNSAAYIIAQEDCHWSFHYGQGWQGHMCVSVCIRETVIIVLSLYCYTWRP